MKTTQKNWEMKGNDAYMSTTQYMPLEDNVAYGQTTPHIPTQDNEAYISNCSQIPIATDHDPVYNIIITDNSSNIARDQNPDYQSQYDYIQV